MGSFNLTRKPDVLLVTDAQTTGWTEVHPFLSSKYVDYKGSGTLIWAMVETGSTLDTIQDIRFKSHFGNSVGIFGEGR